MQSEFRPSNVGGRSRRQWWRSARTLHVALNLTFLHEQSGGVGRYARELVPALLELEPGIRITAFVSRELPQSVREAPWARELNWIELPVRTSGGPPGTFAIATAAQWAGLPLLAAMRRVQLVHGLANVAPLWMPGAATVVTLLDLVWLAYPETMTPAATRGMKLVALPSVRRADRVIAISHAAKRDMVSRLCLEPSKVDVTPLAVSGPRAVPTAEPILRARLKLGNRPAALCVSAKNPHKNLMRLIDGFATVAGDSSNAVLIIAGAPSAHDAALAQRVQELALEERVRLLEWVSDEDLEGLYALARCVVYPSLMEGFGLPVLEAMRRGVPVACSAISAVSEVAGNAAELFDPFDSRAIGAALARVLTDTARREELMRLGTERCHQYTWRATAEATLGSYHRAIACRR